MAQGGQGSALLPYQPTPLGVIDGLTARPSIASGRTAQAVDDAGINSMANESMDHVGGLAAPAPKVPFTELKTKIDPETGEQSHSVSGMTDAFLKEVTSLTQIGRQAQGAYDTAIAKVDEKRKLLEDNPILAGVGRYASLGALAYQRQGLRGRGLVPLVNAAGAYANDTFGETPEQLAIKSAQLSSQKLATEVPIANTLERGAAVEQASLDRADRLAQARQIALDNVLQRQEKDFGDDAARGFTTKESANLFREQYIKAGGRPEEAEAIVQRGLQTSAEALKNRTPAETAMKMRAAGVTNTGNVLVDAMSQQQAASGLTVRTKALGMDKLPEKYRVSAAVLGIPNDIGYLEKHPDQAKKLEQYSMFEANGLDVDATARLLVEHPKDNPLSIYALRDVVANFSRGAVGVAFKNAVNLRAAQLDPSWSPKLNDIKLAKITDFYETNKRGSSGFQRRSFDTLMTHAGAAYAQLERMSAITGIPIAQLTINKIKSALGDAEYQILKTELDAVQREYPTLLSGGYAPYEKEIEEAKGLFSADGGKQQIIGALKGAVTVAAGRWGALNTDFKHLIGVDFPEPFGDESLAAAQALGVKMIPAATNPVVPPGALIIEEK